MKIVVISSPDKFHTEVATINKLFDEGLETFHLRKQKFGLDKLEEYLRLIPTKHHNKIVIHSHHKLAIKYKLKGIHLSKKHRKKGWKTRFRIRRFKWSHPKLIVTRSCHQLADLTQDTYPYDYVFLTPIFDGISKPSHNGGFSERALRSMIPQSPHNVYAMGGIHPDNIQQLKSYGFKGAALLGALWKYDGEKADIYHEAVIATQQQEAQLA